ncbi:hypothetical protein ECAE60S_00237 [Eoetvoesiella caeni]
MRSMSQTLIGVLREEISEYRRLNRMSRETIAAGIVEAHERMGVDSLANIRFEPKTLDVFERQKVNADRIFRWLDDETKDGTLMPANFLQSVLAGVPDDVRRRALDRILQPLGFTVRSTTSDHCGSPVSANEVAALIREQSEAVAATTSLLGGADRSGLVTARREMAEAVDMGETFLARLDAQIAETPKA